MASVDLLPLRFKPTTGEPFIPFAAPYENFILTPPRLSDVDTNYNLMNDPKIIRTLEGPPYPYLQTHAVEWVNTITKQAEDDLREFREAAAAPRSSGGARKFVGSCPVRYIREVKEDGTDVMIGDVWIHRCGYPDVVDATEKARLTKENEAREVGDADLMWCIGSTQSHIYLLSRLVRLFSRLSRELAPWKGHHDRCGSNTVERMDRTLHGRESYARRSLRRKRRECEGV